MVMCAPASISHSAIPSATESSASIIACSVIQYAWRIAAIS